MEKAFNTSEYAGRWYELLRYPVPFQQGANYNTTADYTLLKDGTVNVVNTTYLNGKKITAHGIAHPAGEHQFHVDFDDMDMRRLMPNKKEEEDHSKPNYIIQRIWLDDEHAYSFAVVTNMERDALWMLSRKKRPSLAHYEEVLKFVSDHYDSAKFILTPHYT